MSGGEVPGGHASAGPEHRLERLVFFSDAVFAIAITLLVIEIRAPHLPAHATTDDYWAALLELTPEFGGFLISFFAIGSFWRGHHRIFAVAHRWHDRVGMPNLLLLGTVAALPFFTAFFSANPSGRLPAVLYCLWLLLAGLTNLWLQRVVMTPPVVDDHADREHLAFLHERGVAVVLGAASAAVLAGLSPIPNTGLIALASIAPWRALLTWARRRRAA
jgi:uncharacterized membrane protein